MTTNIAWPDHPAILFSQDKIGIFWPDPSQSKAEQINATTRFIIYTTCILFVIKRDLRVPMFGAMMMGLIYALEKNRTRNESIGIVGNESLSVASTVTSPRPVDIHDAPVGLSCQQPSIDNPMANVLLSDYMTEPNRPPACKYGDVKDKVHSLVRDTIPYDCGRSRCPLPQQQQYAAARQFVSNPVTSIPGDQTAFAEWCYGKKFQPLCRDTQAACDPNARGVQLEAFAGLDSAMNPRTGMSGGTV